MINISTDLYTVIDELDKAILQNSEQFKNVIKRRNSDKSKPWYDNECKTMLQSFRTSRTVNNLDKYIECKHQQAKAANISQQLRY